MTGPELLIPWGNGVQGLGKGDKRRMPLSTHLRSHCPHFLDQTAGGNRSHCENGEGLTLPYSPSTSLVGARHHFWRDSLTAVTYCGARDRDSGPDTLGLQSSMNPCRARGSGHDGLRGRGGGGRRSWRQENQVRGSGSIPWN